jgi:hypothetical protein
LHPALCVDLDDAIVKKRRGAFVLSGEALIRLVFVARSFVLCTPFKSRAGHVGAHRGVCSLHANSGCSHETLQHHTTAKQLTVACFDQYISRLFRQFGLLNTCAAYTSDISSAAVQLFHIHL